MAVEKPPCPVWIAAAILPSKTASVNMFDSAVFGGDIEAAIRAGQGGFTTAIDLGKS